VNEKPKITNEMQITPNPVSDEIEISMNNEIAEIGMIEIYDYLGIKQMEIDEILSGTSGSVKINVSSLTKGIYFLKINSGNKYQMLKFVKL